MLRTKRRSEFEFVHSNLLLSFSLYTPLYSFCITSLINSTPSQEPSQCLPNYNRKERLKLPKIRRSLQKELWMRKPKHTFVVHKNVLCAASPFFEAACKPEWMDQDRIIKVSSKKHIPGCHGPGVELCKGRISLLAGEC